MLTYNKSHACATMVVKHCIDLCFDGHTMTTLNLTPSCLTIKYRSINLELLSIFLLVWCKFHIHAQMCVSNMHTLGQKKSWSNCGYYLTSEYKNRCFHAQTYFCRCQQWYLKTFLVLRAFNIWCGFLNVVLSNNNSEKRSSSEKIYVSSSGQTMLQESSVCWRPRKR